MRWLAWIRFWLERAVLRGSLSLVVLLIALQGVLAVGGGAVAYFLPGQHFSTLRAALWWAVLRISDPGYLSDDIPDVSIRALSVALSVVGMAVTVGGIVAIVTQVMNRALDRLAAATTPVPFQDHFVLIGWSDRSSRLLVELLTETKSRIVILLDHVGPEVQRRVRRAVTGTSHLERIVLRAGSAYRPLELSRAACEKARAVILPASPRAVAGDPAEGPLALKCLLALRTLFERTDEDETPIVVVELVDRGLIPRVQAAMPKVRVLPSDRVTARVMRLALQERGLVSLAQDVARPDRGLRVVTHLDPSWLGQGLFAIQESLRGGRVMGVLRSTDAGVLLQVDDDLRVESGDRVLVLSEGQLRVQLPPAAAEGGAPEVDVSERATLRVLVLGWNEVAPDLLGELSLEPEGRYAVDFLSTVSEETMQNEIEETVGACPIPIRTLHGDPVMVEHVQELELAAYDRFVVLADRTVGADMSDVRALAIAVAIQGQAARLREGAYLILELLEQENTEVITGVESVTTPLLAADVLASLALSDLAHESLKDTFTYQQCYVTRVVGVPQSWIGRPELRRALLRRGFAYLETLEPGAQASISASSLEALGDSRREVPVVVVEPARVRHRGRSVV